MDSEELKRERNALVTKSNRLIQKSSYEQAIERGKSYELSAQEQKLLLYIISKVHMTDEQFEWWEFSIDKFCKVCGIDSKSGKNWTDVRAILLNLHNKAFWCENENGEQQIFSWLEQARINPNTGKIFVKLSDTMREFLLFQEDHFTSYPLIYALHFKSKYSIALYEYIQSIHFNYFDDVERRLDVDELRERLHAEKYTDWQSLNRRAFSPAVDEINKNSDKNVTYDLIKIGRIVVGVKLHVSSKRTLDLLPIEEKINADMGGIEETVVESSHPIIPPSADAHSFTGESVVGYASAEAAPPRSEPEEPKRKPRTKSSTKTATKKKPESPPSTPLPDTIRTKKK